MKRLFFTFIKLGSILLVFALLVFFLGPGRQPSMAIYHHILGWQNMENKQYTDAIHEFKVSLAGHPFQMEALNNIAYCNYQLGDKQEALNYYWLITDQDPKNYTAHLSIARILMQMGWPKESLKVYEQLLRFYPGDKSLMIETASAYFEAAFKRPEDYQNNLTKSYKLFYEGFQGSHPEPPLNPWLQYAEASYRLGYFDTALWIYCPVLTQANSPPEATYLFSKSLEGRGLYQNAAVWMQVAINEMADKDSQKAEKWFHQSQDLSSNFHHNQRVNSEDTQEKINDKEMTPFQKNCMDSLAIHPKYQLLLESITSGRKQIGAAEDKRTEKQ